MSIQDVQEERQSQNKALQWHQEEEQTNHERQYTYHKPKKKKQTANSLFPNKVIKMLENQKLDNEIDKTRKKPWKSPKNHSTATTKNVCGGVGGGGWRGRRLKPTHQSQILGPNAVKIIYK